MNWKAKKIWAPILFFLAYLAIGLAIYGDYGISWDEPLQRNHGLVSAKYVDQWYDFTEDSYAWEDLDTYQHRYYGVWFTLPAVLIEKGMGLQTFREIFRMRHLLVFSIFWLSCLVFYHMLLRRFHDWRWALLGVAFLIFTPRIFAHSFFNPKDIPLLSLYILGIYTFFSFWLRPQLGHILLFGLACGMLVSMRIVGVILPAVAVFLILLGLLFNRPWQAKWFLYYGLGLMLAIPLGAMVAVLFWPYLWEAPWPRFQEAFQLMAQYPWTGKALFRGELLTGPEVPWYYIPWWMAISIPLLYLLLFLVGVYALFPPFLHNISRWKGFCLWANDEQRQDWGMLAFFLAPILAVIVKGAVVYDGWRHLFFVYPCLVYLAVLGLWELWKRLASKPIWRKALMLTVGVNLLYLLAFIIRYHPHQNVHFNLLAAGNQLSTYDLDYWGVSYKQALEKLAEIDGREKIKVAANSYPAQLNWEYLKPGLRPRFEWVDDYRQADYYLSTYRHYRPGLQQLKEGSGPYAGEEVYTIRVGKSKICGVYKVQE